MSFIERRGVHSDYNATLQQKKNLPNDTKTEAELWETDEDE